MPREQTRPHRTSSSAPKIDRTSHLRWIPIAETRISDDAQRKFRPAHAREYADNFDLDGLGYPVVNFRDGHWYIIDGQHRVAALRMIGYGDQQIECEAYEGLTEAEEAEVFLKRNRRRTVRAFDHFMVGVRAGREVETVVRQIVLTCDLKVSEKNEDGCISAVVALVYIYKLGGDQVLARALRIARDAYGKDHEALKSDILRGIGLVCHRYNGKLDDARAVQKMSKMYGGVGGLRGKARTQAKASGRPIEHCVGAVIVDEINKGMPARSPDRLESWWT